MLRGCFNFKIFDSGGNVDKRYIVKSCAEKVIDIATLFWVSVQTQGGIVGCVCVNMQKMELR